MYNLKIEMLKEDIRQIDIAELLQITKQAANYKVNGVNRFTFEEMKLIQETYFPGQKIEYLFKMEV